MNDPFDEVLQRDALRRVNKLPGEATVAVALSLPYILFTPMLQLLQELEEENAKVLSLILRAKVDGRDNLAGELAEEVDEVEVWNA